MGPQSKLGSFVEACANTFAGYVLALVCMNIIMWAYGFAVTPAQTSVIVTWMTVVSIVRGYVIRRFFNRRITLRDPYSASEDEFVKFIRANPDAVRRAINGD